MRSRYPSREWFSSVDGMAAGRHDPLLRVMVPYRELGTAPPPSLLPSRDGADKPQSCLLSEGVGFEWEVDIWETEISCGSLWWTGGLVDLAASTLNGPRSAGKCPASQPGYVTVWSAERVPWPPRITIYSSLSPGAAQLHSRLRAKWFFRTLHETVIYPGCASITALN